MVPGVWMCDALYGTLELATRRRNIPNAVFVLPRPFGELVAAWLLDAAPPRPRHHQPEPADARNPPWARTMATLALASHIHLDEARVRY
jgi:hypothetical protein